MVVCLTCPEKSQKMVERNGLYRADRYQCGICGRDDLWTGWDSYPGEKPPIGSARHIPYSEGAEAAELHRLGFPTHFDRKE